MFVPFEVGQQYKRSGIHDRYGGSRQSGISPSSQSPYVFIFTGEAGHQFGYFDGWEVENELYLYAGDGQLGDMEFIRGNRAIRDHLKDGKQLLLFQMAGKGRPVTFLGEFICDGYRLLQGPDRDGAQRRIIQFELRLATKGQPVDETPLAELQGLEGVDLASLRKKVIESLAAKAPSKAKEIKVTHYERSQLATLYVRRRAAGSCEGCGALAPFHDKDGQPYLEAHHIRRKADQGLDHPEWMVAICPNCHRRVHYAADGDSYNDALRQIAVLKESKTQY